MLAACFILLALSMQILAVDVIGPSQCSGKDYADGQYLKICGSEYAKVYASMSPDPAFTLDQRVNITVCWTSNVEIPILYSEKEFNYNGQPLLPPTISEDLCHDGHWSDFECPLRADKTYTMTKVYHLRGVGFRPGVYEGYVKLLAVIASDVSTKKQIMTLKFKIILNDP